VRKQLTIEELSAPYAIEQPHVDHVARLALRLFDRTRRALRLPAGDRRLLEAACRLHDVAFVQTPDAHAVRGAWLIASRGLAGFSRIERDIVAAAVSVHSSRDPRRPLIALPLCRADELRALRLAAFLRVADALDHGHIQDTVIRSVRVSPDACTVRVRALYFPQNAERARRRSDTWNRWLPLPLRLEEDAYRQPQLLFRGVVGPEHREAPAAQRLLASQFRIMRDNLGLIASGPDPAYLHDLRVAMRRFRAALRFFRGTLRGTAAERLSQDLDRLSDRLGPFRDSQWWLAFLESDPVQDACAAAPGWTAFLAARRRESRRQWRRLCAACRSPETLQLMRRLSVFVRADLSGLVRADPGRPLHELAARRLNKAVSKLFRHGVDPFAASSDELHALRKRCRRLRYWAEFAAPALGAPVAHLADDLKAVAGALGAVHDMDVHLAAGAAARPRLPRALRRHMEELRDREFARFVTRNRLARRKKVRLHLENVLQKGA
jgi:CHAD domain-containing protein